MEPVATTRTVLSVSASTCSATGRMFLLLGRITTSSDPTDSTAFTRSAVAGFMVWPPTTWWCTPSERKMRPMPSPDTTATTLVVGGGPKPSTEGPAPGAPTFSRTQRSSSTCSSRSVTRIRCGLPISIAASMAAADVVGVDVAVPHPVAPDDDDGVADAGPHVLEPFDGVVGRGEQVHDLVAEIADRVLRRRRIA